MLVKLFSNNLLKLTLSTLLYKAVEEKFVESLINRKKLEINRNIYPIHKKNPLISIRISTFNRASILSGRTIPSILNQTYKNFELVIVSDYCTDETEEVIRSFKDARIKFYHSNMNPYDKNIPKEKRWYIAGLPSFLMALDHCQGEWIATCDDDDEWAPTHLEDLLNLALNGDYEMAFSKVKFQLSDSQWDEIGRVPLQCGQISHAAVIYHRRLMFLKYDFNVYKYRIPADWMLWSKMKRAGAKIGFLNKVTAKHYKENVQK